MTTLGLIKVDRFYKPENRITDAAIINKSDKLFNESSLFASFMRRHYACKCGSLSNQHLMGEYCTACKTRVKERPLTESLGWLDLLGNRIINPALFPFFVQIISNFRKNLANDFSETASNLEAALLKVRTKNAKKLNVIKFLLDNRKYWYIEHIPVLPVIMRPGILINGQLQMTKINVRYLALTKHVCSNLPAVRGKYAVDIALKDIQTEANAIHKEAIQLLVGKEGLTRHSLLGCRINFSTRAVIVPEITGTLRLDEIAIPYKSALQIFKLMIIRKIKAKYKCSFYQAAAIHKLMFTEPSFICQGQQIIKTILGKNGFPAILNRNPTISWGSMIKVRIKFIKSPSDYTFSLNNLLLHYLTGDYDGDQLLVFPLFNEHMLDTFKPANLALTFDLKPTCFLAKEHAVGMDYIWNS